MQHLNKNLVNTHPSKDPVSYLSRGIKLLDKKDHIHDGYLYVGKANDLKAVLSKDSEIAKPICVVSAGKCEFFNDKNPIPEQLFLIETNLDLIPLYNLTQDCYHRTVNQKPTKPGELFLNNAFQNLLTDILDSRVTDSDEIKKYLIKNNLDTSSYFRLYALRFNSTTHTGSIAWNYLLSTMQQIFPSSYTATYSDAIVILDRNANKNPNFKVNEEAIRPLLEQYDGYFGVGNICGHLVSIPAVYSQIMAGINYGIQIDPKERIYYYEDYAMYQLVELALEAANRGMHTRNPIHLMNNEAVSLLEHDARHNDNLLSVLDCYLLHNCNLKETSDALFIHRNTLRNKLDKIEKIMGCQLGNPNLEERLRFSCTTYRYMTKVLKADPLKLRRNSEQPD